MADREALSKPGYYWDHQECSWVKCDQLPLVVVPEQPQTGVEDEVVVDVRSG